jgi:uncharacterized protein
MTLTADCGVISMENPRSEDPILDELVRLLVDAFRPERIYLFGSRARGEVGADSDYDLMVVLAVPEIDRGHRTRVWNILWDVGKAADVILIPRERFEQRARVVCSLPSTVLREGLLLYAA